MTKKPLVTVITPVYNQCQYIEETIKSVLSQDYPKIEYVVVDDGSTDGTPEVIKKYSKEIKIITHLNMGQYATVNKAFPSTTGEIVGIVNSDDPLLNGSISAIVNFFETNPDILVVYPDWNLIDSDGQLIKSIKTSDYSYVDMVRLQHCIPGPAAFFRRGIFDELGGRNPEYKFMADFDFWLRAGLLGDFKRLPKVLATFRVHENSITVSQRNDNMAKEHVRVVKDFFKNNNLPGHIRKLKFEAYGSAYYLAGTIYIKDNFFQGLMCFLKSILFCPKNKIMDDYYLSRFKDIFYSLISSLRKLLYGK